MTKYSLLDSYSINVCVLYTKKFINLIFCFVQEYTHKKLKNVYGLTTIRLDYFFYFHTVYFHLFFILFYLSFLIVLSVNSNISPIQRNDILSVFGFFFTYISQIQFFSVRSLVISHKCFLGNTFASYLLYSSTMYFTIYLLCIFRKLVLVVYYIIILPNENSAVCENNKLKNMSSIKVCFCKLFAAYIYLFGKRNRFLYIKV